MSGSDAWSVCGWLGCEGVISLGVGEPVQKLIYGVRVLVQPVLQRVSSDFVGRKEDRAALRRG